MEFIETEPIHDLIDEAYAEDSRKIRVECICPKCRKRHFMKMHWIGEFKPWKYCKQCRNSLSFDF